MPKSLGAFDPKLWTAWFRAMVEDSTTRVVEQEDWEILQEASAWGTSTTWNSLNRTSRGLASSAVITTMTVRCTWTPVDAPLSSKETTLIAIEGDKEGNEVNSNGLYYSTDTGFRTLCCPEKLDRRTHSADFALVRCHDSDDVIICDPCILFYRVQIKPSC